MLGRQRALVVGLAREGIDLTKFLAAHGASVRDRPEIGDQLREACAQVEGDGVRAAAGRAPT
jgi:UDP-N-acetylmuramoylalanine-D-glutamate ligase